VRRSAPPVPKKHTLSAPTPSAPKQALSLRRVLDQHAPSLKIPTPAGVDIVKQTDYLLAGVPSLAAFLAFNFVNKFILRSMLQITFFPPPLIGMFLFYLAMLSMQDSDAEKCVKFFEPAVALLTNFLPVLFSPGLICTPSATVGIGLVDFLKFTLVIGLGMTAVIFQTGTLTDYIMKISKSVAPLDVPPKFSKFVPWFSREIELVLGSVTLLSGLLAVVVPSLQHIFFVATTIFSFIFAARLPRLLDPTVAKYWHPLMTTYFAATAILTAQGWTRGIGLQKVLKEYLIPGATWDKAAGNFVMFFLEPAIISFSFGLYARRQLLRANAAAILAGSFSSAFMGILTMAGLSRVMKVPRTLGLALMPRATAALAVVQAGMIGASTSLTTVHCCIIGVLGANFGRPLCDLMRFNNPIARGVACGGSGLALASAALAQTDPAAFPFGTLTMSITSTIATFLFSIPAFQQLVFWVAGVEFVHHQPVVPIVLGYSETLNPVEEQVKTAQNGFGLVRDKVLEFWANVQNR